MFFLELSCFFDDPTNVGNLISDASAFSKTSLNIWKFLSDQCKEIKKNNRMGKTKDLFKKIRDIKENFHAKVGTIKERNCMDLTEAEVARIHKTITEKKVFMTQITTVV